ncbi:adenylyl-sulfate kinase [Solihabitans fulvus]|uniref:Adenylyl-sulfate kinase n=1 Tax=Solihabitans fulvus TaxID=1892852 RepID=A0A5B2WWY6_9PSEU|nr:adenylyl-sulfate kinase [Solihabitans fulvus]KAA2255380.1 adenylyl-sulfate kinase [Solihabitans fulvus]
MSGNGFHAELSDTGVTVWLTGLPSSGKSTIAQHAAAALVEQGRRVQILDGDELRKNLCADLGFSRADRETNVRRVGCVAELLARNGVVVLVPVIAPYEQSRQAVRALHEAAGTRYLEAYVATPVAVCAERDVKGLYARQRAGEISGLTGVDDPYEAPRRPDILIDTTGRAVADSARLLLDGLSAGVETAAARNGSR